MKRRTALIISASLFVIVLAVFFGSLINGSMHNEGSIVLPQGSMQIEEAADIAKRNQRQIAQVTVTADNVQRVVETLSRPSAYSYSAELVYHYPHGSSSKTAEVYVSGDRSRVNVKDSQDTVEKQLVYTKDSLYIWGSDGVLYYEGDRGSFTPEDEAGVPTYESILSLAPSSVTDGGVREYSGRLCVYLTSSYELGRYTRDWYVDIDSGLLHACDTKENGAVIYSVTCRDMQIGEQEQSLFASPIVETDR